MKTDCAALPLSILAKACERKPKVLDLLLNLIPGRRGEIRLQTHGEPAKGSKQTSCCIHSSAND
jgi:hypothetical protein